MRLLAFASLLSSLVAGCGPSLYGSRVPVAPLDAKLRASGGDPAQILHPVSLGDLAALEPGRRYKFAVLQSGSLAIAPLPADRANNEYTHPVLAAGGRVRTAGGLRVEREGAELVRVIIDQDSRAYCPSLRSLDAARDALVALGVRRPLVQREDRPPRCIAQRADRSMR